MENELEQARARYGAAIAKRQLAERAHADANDALRVANREEEAARSDYRDALQKPLDAAIKAAGGETDDMEDD